MVAALKKRGIDVPYIVKDDEGHGFHNEENRLELYAAMEKFLAQHLTAPVVEPVKPSVKPKR
jgi:dipeptidyl aminopeptidase/acylaminoacyl peptidase